MAIRWLARLTALIACVAVGSVLAPPATAASCRGVRATVGGRPLCLVVGGRCVAANRSDYLAAGFDCVRAGRRRVLRRAGLGALRRGRVLDLGPSGRPTFRQALWAFSATVARLPAVRVPAGAVGVDRSGTGAIKSLELYVRRLTRRQQAILRAIVTPHPQAIIDPSTGSVRAVAHAASAAQLAQVGVITNEAIRRLQAHGMVFRHAISLQILDQNFGGEAAHTVATWFYGTGSVCAISYRPFGLSLGIFELRTTTIHELMHCAAAEQSTSADGFDGQPKYLDEGLPEWASYRVAVEWQGRIGFLGWWQAYLRSPELGVRTRSYDAVGWWSLLEHLGVDLWKLQPSLVKSAESGDSTKPFQIAAGAAPSSLAVDWGPTLATNASLGARWDLDGPGMPPRAEPRVVVANGGSFGRGVATAGGYESAIGIRADVIHVVSTETVGGYLRDGGGTDRPIPRDQRYCALESGCQCPDGHALPFERIVPGDGRIGFADRIEAGAVLIEGQSLDTVCAVKTPPTPPRHACRALAGAGVVAFVGPGGGWQGFGNTCGYGKCLSRFDDAGQSKCGLFRGATLSLIQFGSSSQARGYVRSKTPTPFFTTVNVGADLARVARKPDGSAATVFMAVGRTVALFSMGTASDRPGPPPPWNNEALVLLGARRIAAASP